MEKRGSKRKGSAGIDCNSNVTPSRNTPRKPEKKKRTAPTNTSLLPPCKVCNEPAAGFHYGANTCEACKGFFRRTLVRGGEYDCINGDSKCDVVLQAAQVEKKRICPRCRHTKCLQIGMSPDAIKVGRYTHSKRTQDVIEYRQAKTQGSNSTVNSPSSSQNSASASPAPASALSESLRSHSTISSPSSLVNEFHSTAKETTFSALSASTALLELSTSVPSSSSNMGSDKEYERGFGVNSNGNRDYGVDSRENEFDSRENEFENREDGFGNEENGLNIENREETSTYATLTPVHVKVISSGNSERQQSVSPTPSQGFPFSASTLMDKMVASVVANEHIRDDKAQSVSESRSPNSATDHTVSDNSPSFANSNASIGASNSTSPAGNSTSHAANSKSPAGNHTSQTANSISHARGSTSSTDASDSDYMTDEECKKLTWHIVDSHEQMIQSCKYEMTPEEMLEKQQECYEKCKASEEAFGHLGNLSHKEYIDFYRNTGIDLDNRQDFLTMLSHMLDQNIREHISFVKTIPGFSTLSLDDQIRILKDHRCVIGLIYQTVGFNRDLHVHIFPSGRTFCIHEMTKLAGKERTEERIHLLKVLQNLNLSVPERILSQCLALFTLGSSDMDEPEKISAIQWKIMQCLRWLLKENGHENPDRKLAAIIDAFYRVLTFTHSFNEWIKSKPFEHYAQFKDNMLLAEWFSNS